MRVAVIGAGIAGLSTAWGLARRGVEVTLYEQGPIPNPLGASGDHHRIIRRAYGGHSGYQRRITDAYLAWDALWEDIGASHLVPCGFLLISQFPGDSADRMRQGLADLGDPYQTFPPDEAARRYPYLDQSSLSEVSFSAEGGALMCRMISTDLLAWLKRHGVTVRDHTRVAVVDHEAGRVTTATADSDRFDRIVVTAGAWVLGLAPDLAAELTPWRTAVAYAEPPADLADAWAASPVILDTGGAHSDGYILPPVRGAGLKFGTGKHRYESGPDQNRDVLPDEGAAILGHFSPPFARLGEYRVTDVVSCAYTFTADEHFLARRIGRSTVVSACSGHGYKFGAAVGLRVADAVLSGDDAALAAWIEARD
ncbi:glycine/D-amino acid oxidase-like deaminating enzyme [Hoeflea marina]|uniref:Glycine/D-amino acid oxidase-like deaminating enzyme n=1 Tax=Hoeflea marina TaxID=274592 RepID=A0A317PSP4_9HYPH|nr:FAD-dependent oxidoreductase [Hoeflea marina]PWW04498.1 glycine/D-amino acid oxidase-like deaminating enzyme [Hoeflea marina]